MKTKIFMGCLLATSLLATSCQDFLQEDPKGKPIIDNIFNTIDGLNMSLNSLYYHANQTHIYSNMVYPQVQGDDVSANPGGNKQAVADLDAFRATSDNKGVKDCWNRHYILIKAANSIIINAPKVVTSSDEQKTQVAQAVAQAKYWRAYSYFTLVRLYGPLVWNEDNVNDDFTSKPSSVADIYNYIVTDLQECENILPISYSSAPAFMNGVNVFVTRAAAKSTLSAVYMAMAGFPLNKGKKYYNLAAEKAFEVIDNESEYGLALDERPDAWQNVYSMNNNYNNETVLGLNFSPLVDWGQDSQFTSCGHFESLGGWGDFWGELKFWERFPEGPRKDAIYSPKILKPNEVGGTLYDWWNNEIIEQHPMFSLYSVNWEKSGNSYVNVNTKPFDYRVPVSQNMTNDHRHRLIRYSEVLLWYAEAVGRAGQGDLDKAKECLERVRKRAMIGQTVDGTDYTEVNNADWDKINGKKISSMTYDDIAQAAYEEHGWEVGGYMLALVTRRADQLRMNDLKRTFEERVADEGISPAEGITVKEGVKVSGSWKDEMNYLPYPDTEQAKNEHLRNVDRFADKID